MPQLVINSQNISIFQFKVTFDLFNRKVVFDFSGTTYNGSGISLVQGISVGLVDQDGVTLATLDFTSPSNYIVPSVTQILNVDLSSVNYAFLFQAYAITAAIKDQNGTVFTIPTIYKKICQPNDFQESGYVCGQFQVRADCNNNDITAKEFTVLVYNNLTPQSVSKTGTLSYPTGTISAINFSNTPFSNNVVYTGQYRINCTTVATYNLNDDTYVLVNYVTAQQFDITCSNRVSDLLCCISDLYQTKIRNCDNAIGKRAAQQLQEIEIPFFLGLGQEMNGQDAEWAYQVIKKSLNCNCGNSALGQNEVTPINPSVYSIVLTGAGGTGPITASTVGNTKTFTIPSNVYQVVKGNSSDTSFTITIDTSVLNTVKYLITFNYAALAAAIYTATSSSPTLIAQLNSLISASTNIDLSNLNGKCVIDLSSSNYFLSYIIPNGAVGITNIVIGSTTYNAPGGLIASNVSGIEAWLNGLGLGTFEVDYSVGLNGSYFNVLINSNTNSPVSMSLLLPSGAVIVPFQKTNKSLIAFLQAFIDYVCQLTALQVALGTNLSLCSFDYNGVIQTTGLSSTSTQNDFNVAASTAICNIANRINTLTGVTCAKIQSIFQDNPSGSFGPSDRLYGTLGGNCASLTDFQLANVVIAAVGKYSSVKTAWCAIDCTTPGTCPDVSAVNVSATSQTQIGFYGVTWSQTPSANQIVTVRYRVTGTTTWIISSNSINLFPNGNINGTTPYVIPGLTQGTTYDIWVQNNCGGNGFITQVTTPANTVYSGSFLLDNVIYNICGDSPVTLYSSLPFASGVTMYSNIGLTTPVTGFSYIAPTSGGQIYQLNSSTGVVGVNTGSTCNSGTPGAYILGNSTSTICSGSIVTLYTNGAFAIGSILYSDPSLTTPVTGSSYAVFNNVIYNVNSSTGQVISSTGLSCVSSATLTIDYIKDVSADTGSWHFNLNNPLPFNLNIDNGLVTGYTGVPCNFTSGETDIITPAPFVFMAGHTSGTLTVGGISCLNSPGVIIQNDVTVNGSHVSNGSVIVISGVSITIVIQKVTCTHFPC